MKKISTRFLAILVVAVTLVCCMGVAASAAAPADGTIYPIFVLSETQPQYKFYYTTAAKGTNPMTGRIAASVGDTEKVTYENDGAFNLIIDKLGDEMGRAMIAFTAPADGEYTLEFTPGLWWEGSATSYAIEVYVDGVLVEGSHAENVGGTWGSAYSITVKAREGKEICIVPCFANEGGPITATSQPLKIVNYKLTYVQAATFETEGTSADNNDDGDNANTADAAISAVVVVVASVAVAAVIGKKSHR